MFVIMLSCWQPDLSNELSKLNKWPRVKYSMFMARMNIFIWYLVNSVNTLCCIYELDKMLKAYYQCSVLLPPFISNFKTLKAYYYCSVLLPPFISNFRTPQRAVMRKAPSQRANRKRKNVSIHLSHSMAKPTKWHVSPPKTQISLGIRPVWSESSWRKLGSLALLSYGKNSVSMFSQSPLIGSLSNLQVMRTGIKSRVRSNSGWIKLFTSELFALERFHWLWMGKMVTPSFLSYYEFNCHQTYR